MFFKIIVFIAFVSVVASDSVQEELKAVYQSHGEPFFELPCMLIGGRCAKEDSCPEDSKVVTKGLCPVQQADGYECCKPEEPNIRCRARGGECVSTEEFQCPDFLTVRHATDCAKEEACCIFVK